MKREEIIQIRKDNRYTQKQVAQILGISYSLYQKIEYGLRNPSKEFITNFKQFFKVKRK